VSKNSSCLRAFVVNNLRNQRNQRLISFEPVLIRVNSWFNFFSHLHFAPWRLCGKQYFHKDSHLCGKSTKRAGTLDQKSNSPKIFSPFLTPYFTMTYLFSIRYPLYALRYFSYQTRIFAPYTEGHFSVPMLIKN